MRHKQLLNPIRSSRNLDKAWICVTLYGTEVRGGGGGEGGGGGGERRDAPTPVSGLARALTDSSIQTRGTQLVANGHIDTIYKINGPIYASHEYDRVPMVNIDGGTMSSSSNAGPVEGKV